MELNLYQICHKLFEVKNGNLIRKTNQAPNARMGDIAGWFDEGIGYFRVRIDGKSYLIHRIIYLMVNNRLPDLVDHKDGNPLNNIPSNLREATKEGNRWNCKGNKGSVSGVKGVYFDRGRWKALITVGKERIYLGMFDSVGDAEQVVKQAYADKQGEFAYKE